MTFKNVVIQNNIELSNVESEIKILWSMMIIV